jgi:hypothetical protein
VPRPKTLGFLLARSLLSAPDMRLRSFLSVFALALTLAQPAFAQPTSGADCGSGGAECPVGGIRAAIEAARKKPEIAATSKAIGEHIVAGMARANEGGGDPDSGIHYSHNYEAFFPDRFRKSHWEGHANTKYWKRVGFMTWQLKPGVSASEGIKDWLKGRTIAECLTTINAIQTDALRAAVSDANFDKRFGEKGKNTPEYKRLVIGPGISSVSEFMTDTGNKRGKIGHRNVKAGEHYYFYNHPMYLLKHPGGAWQGENAVFDGEDADGNQTWSGFGASGVSEDGMYTEMVGAYNLPRDERDIEVLEEMFGKDPKKWPKEYREDGGVFPKRITVKDALNAKPYELDGTVRKGGFIGNSGWKLNLEMVKELRGEGGST